MSRTGKKRGVGYWIFTGVLFFSGICCIVLTILANRDGNPSTGIIPLGIILLGLGYLMVGLRNRNHASNKEG